MKCGPDQKTIEICENITTPENSLHFLPVLEQVLMQSMCTEDVAWAAYYPFHTDWIFTVF